MIVGYFMTRNIYHQILPSIRSLLTFNRPERIYIFAEDDDIGIDLPEMVKVINISGQPYIKKSSPNWNSMFSYMVMCRVCTGKFIDDDKILLLDVDTIINDSLEDLWQTDLTGKWFGAVNEDRGKWKPYGDRYFNAGVFLMNLKQIREDRIDDVLIEMLNTHFFTYSEQCAWNKIKADRYVELPTRYNESFCCGFTNNPAVIHYAGIQDWYTNRNIQRREYLDRYLL